MADAVGTTDARWAIAEWTALDAVQQPSGDRRSSARRQRPRSPRMPAFRRAARRRARRLDRRAWTRCSCHGGMGHHGVSVGDVDGDGLDDIYVSQPSGLPNRLFRNNGDGTFEDITEAGRAGRARRHVAVALRGRRQRRRRGPRSSSRAAGRCCSRTTARRGSRACRTRSSSRNHSQGSLTSAAAADYDRDGFVGPLPLRLLLSDRRQRGQGRARRRRITTLRTARPNVLLHNDGHGQFVDVTDAVGPRREQRSIQLRGRVGRLRRGRLARPARRERLRAQEPLPQPGPGQRAGALQGRGRTRRASRTTARA